MNITFTGDVSITGSFTDKVLENSEIFSSEIIAELNNNDFVVVNLEGPSSSRVKNYNNNTPLKSPINTIKYLRSRNVSVFNLANNHILDYGEEGLKDTLNNIKGEKLTYFGAEFTKEKASTPVVLKKDTISIAIFGITKTSPTKIGKAVVFSSDDYSLLKKQIKDYKNKVDYIIVNFHGGEEYSLFPSPVKRRFLKKIARLGGVDCVIAHHSHTFQGWEKYKNTYIFYSLGNFIFDIPNHKAYKETNTSAFLKFCFTKSDFAFSFIPYKIGNGKIALKDYETFKTKLSELCDFSNYQKKWQKETFRILFRKENPLFNDKNEVRNSLQSKSFLGVILSKSFYNKIRLVISDEYLFSLYFNAIIYKIIQKFN